MTTKGYIFSKEQREAMSKAKIGRKLTEEHKANISKGRMGQRISDETKKKMSDARKRYWQQQTVK